MTKRKSLLQFFCAMLLIVPLAFIMSACGHKHNFSEQWTSDKDSHWHICTEKDCDEVSDKANHTAGNWEVDTAATCTTAGTKHKECTECGYVMETETIDATGHSYVEGVCTACGDIQEGYEAKVSNATSAKAYTTLQEAIVAAQNDDTITLAKDIEIATLIPIDKDLTIDFAGHKIDATSGVFDVAYNRANSKLILKNGTINTEKWGVWLQNSAYLKVDSDFTINANITRANTTANAVTIVQGSTADIYGKLNVVGETFALSGNGSAGDGDVTINIYNGAEIKSLESSAIYMPNTGNLNIYGGTIAGKTALYIKSGTTTISGGKFVSVAQEYREYEFYGNGANYTGDAIIVDACGYPGDNPTLTISNAEFELASNDVHKVAHYKYNGNEAKAINVPESICVVFVKSVPKTQTTTEE